MNKPNHHVLLLCCLPQSLFQFKLPRERPGLHPVVAACHMHALPLIMYPHSYKCQSLSIEPEIVGNVLLHVGSYQLEAASTDLSRHRAVNDGRELSKEDFRGSQSKQNCAYSLELKLCTTEHLTTP
jgi:hypothetical protein